MLFQVILIYWLWKDLNINCIHEIQHFSLLWFGEMSQQE